MTTPFFALMSMLVVYSRIKVLRWDQIAIKRAIYLTNVVTFTRYALACL